MNHPSNKAIIFSIIFLGAGSFLAYFYLNANGPPDVVEPLVNGDVLTLEEQAEILRKLTSAPPPPFTAKSTISDQDLARLTKEMTATGESTISEKDMQRLKQEMSAK
ncbi:MAG: hypothetical protein A3B23_01175 [Candidatus Colwellbacteria bacterium RIFCSPLOWO2_01_FULL_48_10]|uniref:Uncharacterized protein n=1 Tax=Candidatus Colwellbacteria bacterium RIFCSPLOWO2_01_FULL_48_10 TaxID=1797690 RepID=A0A1G1Z4G7_9BACT|nr:MAG: hypothetical protein A3B23_01175 [Candidatus Colwellbacteria bacterium RIFCSPLOWO2_01_FULL_48_10]